MRKLLLSVAALAAFIICSSSGCKHDALVAPSANVTPVGNNGTGVTPGSGTWIVAYFNNNGTDMSTHLNGYTFDFQSDGKLVVNTGIGTVNGSWTSETDDSRQKFIISMSGADAMLAELNEDWIIKSSTANELDLTHGNGNNAQEVHFTK